MNNGLWIEALDEEQFATLSTRLTPMESFYTGGWAVQSIIGNYFSCFLLSNPLIRAAVFLPPVDGRQVAALLQLGMPPEELLAELQKNSDRIFSN